MKILYAVQATGNGHISRAMTLLPHLLKYGEVSVFLSGNNSHLYPALPIQHKSKGISLFYNESGGLDYARILMQRNPVKLWKEVLELPVHAYDLVINDFDLMTSLACQWKNVPSVHFGHQASFQSPYTPRPKKWSWHGELLLKNYVHANLHIGLHFKPYANNIFGAIIKEEIIQATPKDQGHITVYLPSHNARKLFSIFSQIKDRTFVIFSREYSKITTMGNVQFHPIDGNSFSQSLIHCHGIICGAGFEAPAEALHLGKKLMAIPIVGQYEQACNAAALQQLGVDCLQELTEKSIPCITQWLSLQAAIQIDYSHSIEQSLTFLFSQKLSQPKINSQPATAGIANVYPIRNSSTLA